MKMTQIFKHMYFEAGKMVIIYTKSCKFGELWNSSKNKQNALSVKWAVIEKGLIQMVKHIISDKGYASRSNYNQIINL